MAKLSPSAERLKRAAEILYGPRGGRKFAAAVGISQTLFAFIVAGDRSVTPDVEQRAAEALRREAKRLRTAADKLDEMAAKMAPGS